MRGHGNVVYIDGDTGVNDLDISAAFTFLGDVQASPPKELIRGLLPADGVTILGGQSGAGKTFMEIYTAICLAHGMSFFGRKIVERVGSVFVAAEGRPLIHNRFIAAQQHLGISDQLPIAWIKLMPDFSTLEGIKHFVAQLKAIDNHFNDTFGVRLGRFVVDTVAATFGMKNEDDNSEATKVCNALRIIADETQTVANAVHHYGKNLESGLRGASAFKGSADLILGALADIDPLSGNVSNRELTCAKARDGEQGPISAFDLEFVKLGLNEDQEAYGSMCVVPVEDRPSRFNKAAKLSKGVRKAIEAINESMDAHGKVIVPRAGMPPVKAVKVSDAQAEFNRRYVANSPADKADNAKRMALKRAIDSLPIDKFCAGEAEGVEWIWKL